MCLISEPIGEIRYTSFAQNITVYWNETRQAEGYVVKLDSSETIFTDETEYTFTDLAPGRRYYITVCGCQQCDEDPRITGNCSSVSAITSKAQQLFLVGKGKIRFTDSMSVVLPI